MLQQNSTVMYFGGYFLSSPHFSGKEELHNGIKKIRTLWYHYPLQSLYILLEEKKRSKLECHILPGRQKQVTSIFRLLS